MKIPGFMKLALILALCLGATIAGWHYLSHRPVGGLILHGNVDIRQVDLAFRVGGRLVETLVDEGDSVTRDQPLARLDTDLLINQRDQALANVQMEEANLTQVERGYRTQEIAKARASVSSAKAAYDNANLNYKRVRDLRAQNAVSQKELDNARAADREARASLKSAEEELAMLMSGYREEEIQAQKARLAAARAQLARAEIELADAVLHAPQKGIILIRAKEAGSIVNQAETVYTLTLTNPVWLRVYVSEPELGLIKPGMRVQVEVDAAPGKLFPGKVGFISPEAEFTPKNVETKEVRTSLVYMIRVQADDPENVMRQGMPVTVHVPDASLK